MTLAELRLRFSLLFDERPFGDTDRDALLNEGYRILASLTKCVKGVGTISSVADCPEYDVPSFMDKIDTVYFRGKQLEPFREHNIYSLYSNMNRAALPSETKFFYRKDYDDYTAGTSKAKRMIGLVGVQDDAAETTAINDAEGIDEDDTAVTVDSTADFPDFGDVLIGTEVIHYTYKSSATVLAGLLRGQEGTTAASHADDATVTLRDVVIQGSKLPAAMTTGTDALISVDEAFGQLPAHYAAGIAYSTIEKEKMSNKHLAIFYSGVERYAAAVDTKVEMETQVGLSWEDYYSKQQS